MKRMFLLTAAVAALALVGCQPATETKTVNTTTGVVKVGDPIIGGFTVVYVDPKSTGYIALREFRLATTQTGIKDVTASTKNTTGDTLSGKALEDLQDYTTQTGFDTGYTNTKHKVKTQAYKSAEVVLGDIADAAITTNTGESVFRREGILSGTFTADIDLTTTANFAGTYKYGNSISAAADGAPLATGTKGPAEWTLAGPVFIGEDNKNSAKITIPAGTIVKGTSSSIAPGMLVISRGSKIDAQGTASAPIIFTSSKAIGTRAPGDWGGLVINGNAPVNDGDATGTDQGEGNSGAYGGSDPHDNSGILKYVRSEFAGVRFTADNELNGIALQGVGDGTTIDYIQAHRSNDDGIEFFGGTVNVRHLVSTGNLDDHLDWTSGWRGSVQFAVLQEYPLNGLDNGFEGDNKENNITATPFSHPVLANFTLVGAGYTSGGPIDGSATPTVNGANFRRGTKVDLYNTIVTNYNNVWRETDTSGSAFISGTTSGVTYKGVLAEGVSVALNAAGAYNSIVYNTVFDGTGVKRLGTAFPANGTLGNYYDVNSANNGMLPAGYKAAFTNKVTGQSYDTWTFAFKPSATAANVAAQTLPADSTTTDYTPTAASVNKDFTATTYVGAVDPAAASDWTTGWTSNAAN